jgi:coenzyme PQQ precursor peptide PqqA
MRPFSQVVSRIDGGDTPKRHANAGDAKRGEVADSSQSRHLVACGPATTIVLRFSVRTQENHESRIPILSPAAAEIRSGFEITMYVANR